MCNGPAMTLAGDLSYIQTGRHAGMTATTDAGWMRLALSVAMAASGRSDPNPAVGAVLVKDGRCIGTGATAQADGPHAERVALDAAGAEQARGATLYVTLEPCAHHGRQPPCVDALIRAGIRRSVIGAQDTDPRVNGRGLARLVAAGIAVSTGCLHREATAWHLPFLMAKRDRRIFVAAKWAQTLDGQLAHDGGAPKAISGAAAKDYTHWLRHRYDAIVVGAGTALNDLPRLTVRAGAWPKYRHPVRVVVDPAGRMPHAPRWRDALQTVFNDAAPVVYLHGADARPQGLGAHVVTCPLDWDRGLPAQIPAQILAHLADADLARRVGRPIQSLLVEGGPRLHALFLAEGVVDVAHVLTAPGFGGGRMHRIQPTGTPPALRVFGTWRIGGDVLTELVSDDIAACLEPPPPQARGHMAFAEPAEDFARISERKEELT